MKEEHKLSESEFQANIMSKDVKMSEMQEEMNHYSSIIMVSIFNELLNSIFIFKFSNKIE